MSDPNNLFFDIETTGLSPESSHVTVIGTMFLENEEPVVRQFVCERPMDERKILGEFSEFAGGFRKITHFNGRSFDIPYLRKKFSFYRVNDPFYDMEWEDLYLIGKKFAPVLLMDSGKQKDFERVFGFQRTDTLSGGDCVSAYREYIRTGNRASLDKILLHNREDLLGMVCIRSRLESFLGLMNGDFVITGVTDGSEQDQSGEALIISFECERSFEAPFEFTHGSEGDSGPAAFFLRIENRSGTFCLPGTERELKFFFENYKDYYYLPLEGRAIHRSVGQFVDTAYREKATKATAFEPVTAVFYPQYTPAIQPAFKNSVDDNISYFRAEDVKSADDLKRVVKTAICMALR